jgi:hypothetical protein
MGCPAGETPETPSWDWNRCPAPGLRPISLTWPTVLFTANACPAGERLMTTQAGTGLVVLRKLTAHPYDLANGPWSTVNASSCRRDA